MKSNSKLKASADALADKIAASFKTANKAKDSVRGKGKARDLADAGIAASGADNNNNSSKQQLLPPQRHLPILIIPTTIPKSSLPASSAPAAAV